MRSHFLCDQNRKLVLNPVFSGSYVSSGISTNSKLTHSKLGMMKQDVVLYIFSVVFFILKITAGIIDHLATIKDQLQVTELQSIQINLSHMKDPTGSCKHRRSKHFAYRNIYISHTIFKVGLCFWICQFMKMDQEICLIVSLPLNLHPLTGIQSVYDLLLHLLVSLIVQSIDLYNLSENVRIISTDLWYRIGNDRKAAFVSVDIAVYDLPGLISQFQIQLMLCLTKNPCFRLAFR